MRLISISTDRNIFDTESPVSRRIKEYGNLFEELHIIVFTLKENKHSQIHLSENTHVYPTNSINKLKYIFDSYRIASKLVDDNSYVTTQDPFETGIVGLWLKNKYGVPLNIQLHTDIMSYYFAKISTLNRIRVFIGKRILKEADSIRVVSKRIQVSLIKKLLISADKISILPVFVETDMFGMTDSKSKKILAISRITKEKNLFFLIDVVGKVIKDVPEAKLVIVGDGPLRKNLQRYVERKGLSDRVAFEGWQADIKKYYLEAGVFVFSSLFEGYGMAAIEAASHMVPVVMSDVGIANEVLTEKSAYICAVNDVECFRRSIVEVLTSPQKRENVARLGFESVRQHLACSKDEYLDRYKKLFQ